jgi:hypothetical protein
MAAEQKQKTEILKWFSFLLIAVSFAVPVAG